jgi:hypothetical protein
MSDKMARVFLAKLIFAGLIVAGFAGPAHAHAEVSAACWQHLAGVDTANTPAADRRYHLERGEPSPCTEFDAAEGSSYNGERRRDEPKQSNQEQRKHRDQPGYHCKWTWRGYKCG